MSVVTVSTLLLCGYSYCLLLILSLKSWQLAKSKSKSIGWFFLVTLMGVFSIITLPILRLANFEKSYVYYLLGFFMISSFSSYIITCQILFEDSKKFLKASIIIAISSFIVNASLFFAFLMGQIQQDFLFLTARRAAIIPIMWTIWLTFYDHRNDLYEPRFKFRYYLVIFSLFLLISNGLVKFLGYSNQTIGDKIFFFTILGRAIFLSIAYVFVEKFELLKIKVTDNLIKSGESSSKLDNKVNVELNDSDSQALNEAEKYTTKIHHAIEVEKIHHQPNFTLEKLSSAIEEPVYKVRQHINKAMGYTNFTKFIRAYRIRDAKELLAKPENKDKKNFAISLDVGFTSLSSFYTSFKEETGVTPSEYRQSILLKKHS